MATKKALMGSSLPPALAQRLGKAVNSVTGVGTAQGGSSPTLEPYSINLLTTASSQTACTLPTPAQGGEIGCEIVVCTISSTTGLVYPDSGSKIDLGSQDASKSVAQNKVCMFMRTSATDWKAILTA